MIFAPIACTMEDLADRARSFDMFRKSYRKNEAMEENRNVLKEKYARGKELGNDVNESRNAIKALTNKIEQIRKENAMRGMIDAGTGEVIKTPEEEQMQAQINKYKMRYQE
jgi:kinesin family member 6/9